jgi:flagellar hook-associated protein 3 FlgL
MSFRIAENTSSANFTSRLNDQRARLNTLQEQISSGKRINRPSDDPTGAVAVLNLRTTQKEIEQFQRVAQTANQKLTAADDALNQYTSMLDRVQTLNSKGLSDISTQQTKDYLATELESMRNGFLRVANLQNGDEYLFGGTRQNAPPYDPATVTPAVTATSAQYLQIEPGANAIAIGVTAESFFADGTSNIFTDLNSAITALRGTGDPVADKATLQNTMTRLGVYRNLANTVQAQVGVGMDSSSNAVDNLSNTSLSVQQRVSTIEDTDVAKAAMDLADAQRSLDATLQVVAKGRHSLFDFLG